MHETNTNELSQATRARLDRGEVVIESHAVTGSPTPRVVAHAVIDAPPDRVWALIDNVSEYARIMAGVKAAQELGRTGTTVRSRVTVGMPFPLKDLTAVSESQHTNHGGGHYTRSWRMIEGDYEHNEGGWVLCPFDDKAHRTLVRYELHAVPKIKIPKKIQELAQKKALPRMFDQLRRLAR